MFITHKQRLFMIFNRMFSFIWILNRWFHIYTIWLTTSEAIVTRNVPIDSKWLTIVLGIYVFFVDPFNAMLCAIPVMSSTNSFKFTYDGITNPLRILSLVLMKSRNLFRLEILFLGRNILFEY
jgi:hypothetical protein